MDDLPLFSEDYLFSRWEDDFAAYRDSGADAELRRLLERWADREPGLTETQLEAQFVELFFKRIWGYWGTGERERGEGFCLNARYGIDGAGQAGGRGEADLALGWWGLPGFPPVPQVLAEFKDVRSGLDAPQRRKGNHRSPVKQCLDYLKYAFDAAGLHSPVFPAWGIVTNMNEFRLYCRGTGDEFRQRFVVRSSDSREPALLGDGEEALRRRFLFRKLFRPEQLLARHGKSELALLLDGQIVRESELEKGFYREYQEYRKFVFEALTEANPQFSGTRGRLVKLAQRFLDRCLFILFCEDMGRALAFPPGLLRDILRDESCRAAYSGNFCTIWELVKQLFRAMRDGGRFPPNHRLNRFNGGLFEELPELENLNIPNKIFCAANQGASPETIDMYKRTLLYLSARYNYGAHGMARERTITLYALGRIFEQSITDLEYMEAEAEGRQSLAALTKRKRDGVYYTPEWITGYIVRETLGAKLAEIRSGLGLELGEELPAGDVDAFRKFLLSPSRRKRTEAVERMRERLNRLDAYERAMEDLRILDPACGS
ncbi:MAG: restriction endonuclease subunit M, partial [Planctomycetota bacterium]|nr:restriction endonuclease subunit M [Planctomycetota bacterium]